MVKRILILGLITLVWLVLMVAPVYAVSVTNALYVADIVAQNSGTATTNVSTVCSINTQALIDGNYIDEDALNTALQTSAGSDVPYMPGVGTNPWVFFISSIEASEQKSYLFYAGGPAMQTGFYYFPASGGMATTDSASLELGNNFEIEQQGYVDTSSGSDKNLVWKEDAFKLYISDTSDITASIYEYQAGSGTWESPDGASGTGWSSTGNTYDDNTTTYAYYTIGAYSWSDYIYLDLEVWSDRLRYWVTREHTDVNTVDLDVYYDSAWHDVWQGVFNVGTWQEKGIGGLEQVTQARMRFWNDDVSTSYWVRLHEFDFRECDTVESVTVTAEDISSGEHEVKATANGTYLRIYVDDVLEDTVALGGASVLDNGNDWSFLTNGSMPYMDYHKITVSGTLKQHIIYERATTFDDQTSYNNDATPTFPTTSSDPDVTATFQNFRPIDEAVCTAGAEETSPEMLTEIPDQPTEFYTEGETEHLPGAKFINDLLNAGGIPLDLFWIPFCFGMAAVAVVFTYYPIRSMMFIAIIGWVIILFFALTGVIPLWPFFVYAVLAGAILVSERVFGW